MKCHFKDISNNYYFNCKNLQHLVIKFLDLNPH
jgi:hypothetical protein